MSVNKRRLLQAAVILGALMLVWLVVAWVSFILL